ncbi:aldehyde dehydrogenase family protein [Rhizorhapis suberifaciens]|uniref:Acetaldehyde dehydrogenase/alcohol dehydrogenase n=1 Tax=Rhizorhapis suberifaciens TaxID=13656 RepID=A0A840HRH4_9SPHN|nr:aldehyde dehydrogenase family protein [Rhizorhapis suberifaciens]MBB4640732.1 acetaldehyde dehydrogenase/alcohol dehydrogenase [Rhizorhapis suberifaciens]
MALTANSDRAGAFEQPQSKTNPAADASEAMQEIDRLVCLATNAQRSIVELDDRRLDAVAVALVETFRRDQQRWAERELAATRIGNLTDKTHKLGLVLNEVMQGLYGARTIGRIGEGQSSIEYAAPIGVVFAVSPLTNPVPNSLFKALLCLKTRNALIVSYPRGAAMLGDEVVATIQGVLAKEGLPGGLVQSCTAPSREKTHHLMRHEGVQMILATGGSQLVREAYSSGKPAFGVGPGNVPAYIAKSADLDRAARDIVRGKSYDNGIVCGSESNIVVHPAVREAFVEALGKAGARVITPSEVETVVPALFDVEKGSLKRELIGVDGPTLAAQAGISGEGVKVLVLPLTHGTYPFLTREKMAPLLTLSVAGPNDGIDLSAELLLKEGAGHTAVIHSTDLAEIDRYARIMPVGRILTNTSATHGMLGESADIPISFMQGSGTWGGNSSTEPISWRHLVNTKRLAFGRR